MEEMIFGHHKLYQRRKCTRCKNVVWFKRQMRERKWYFVSNKMKLSSKEIFLHQKYPIHSAKDESFLERKNKHKMMHKTKGWSTSPPSYLPKIRPLPPSLTCRPHSCIKAYDFFPKHPPPSMPLSPHYTINSRFLSLSSSFP